MNSPVRVAIGVPSGEMLHADFAMSLVKLCLHSKTPISLINSKTSITPIGRNDIVEGAIACQATHLLFLDSDMIFPANVVDRLVEHKKYIVGGTYSKRVAPYQTLGMTIDCQPTAVSSGLLAMSRMPTGCLMIHMSVFEKLKKPYFRYGADEVEGMLVSEDYEFCDRAKEAGVNIYCDVDLSKELIHIGVKNITVDDFKPGAVFTE